jgi:hypothetical protein
MRNCFIAQAIVNLVITLFILAGYAITQEKFFLFWANFSFGCLATNLSNLFFFPKHQ